MFANGRARSLLPNTPLIVQEADHTTDSKTSRHQAETPTPLDRSIRTLDSPKLNPEPELLQAIVSAFAPPKQWLFGIWSIFQILISPLKLSG
jgi:hypothetical protein